MRHVAEVNPKRLLLLASTVLGLTVAALPAHALIFQNTSVSYSSDPAACCDVVDVEVAFGPAAVLAQISDVLFGSAFASIGEFGNVGLQATQRRHGEIRILATVFSDENTNPFGVPQHAQANFIIDGGGILLDGVGAIRYDIRLEFGIRDSAGGFVDEEIRWRTAGVLDSPFFGAPTLTTFGSDIGATLTGIVVEIPLTFVTVDLGIVPAGGSVSVDYEAFFGSDLSATLLEAAGWSFSDPGNLSGVGDFPIITFASPPPSVQDRRACCCSAPASARSCCVGTTHGDDDGAANRRRGPRAWASSLAAASACFVRKAERLGAKVVMPKMPVPGMGWFAQPQDTEGNLFAIWEENPALRTAAGNGTRSPQKWPDLPRTTPTMRHDDQQALALRRLGVLGPLASARLTHRDRRRYFAEAAARTHERPDGTRVQLSARTIEAWYYAYRRGGFRALFPRDRADRSRSRVIAPEIAEHILRVKRERPRRSIRRIIRMLERARPMRAGELHRSTVHRLLLAHAMSARPLRGPAAERRSFLPEHAGDLWVGDALHGPPVIAPDGVVRNAYLRSQVDGATRNLSGDPGSVISIRDLDPPPVPEPSTLAVGVLGLVMLLVMSWVRAGSSARRRSAIRRNTL